MGGGRGANGTDVAFILTDHTHHTHKKGASGSRELFLLNVQFHNILRGEGDTLGILDETGTGNIKKQIHQSEGMVYAV